MPCLMWVFFVRFPSADAAKQARDIVRGRLVTYTGQGNIKHTLHVARVVDACPPGLSKQALGRLLPPPTRVFFF